MGSGSSKDAASSDGARGLRSRGARVFSTSCFSLPSTLSDDQNKEETGSTKGNACTEEVESKSTGGNHERCRKLRLPWHSKMPPLIPDDVEHNGEAQDSTSQIEFGASSSSTATAAIGRSLNPFGRSHSRFGFIPHSFGFRLSRTASLGSSRAHSLFSDNLSIPNNDGGDHILVGLDSSADNRIESLDHTNLETNFSRDVVRNNTRVESSISHYSYRNRAESENSDMRRSNRRFGPQEPLEGSVRFSRTRSVGRLRDRVLRRTSSSAGLFGSAVLEDRYIGYAGQANERGVLGDRRRVPSSSDRNNEVWPDSSTNHPYRMGSSIDSSYDHDSETSQLREASNHDLLEHRSAFLERRRRIRSQVRALQRLGSRFENLSGHDRSCILSGQHRTGRCSCRATNRATNPNDDTSTRASISRIVMLAEALFEVLDEIHQQSVALSSRPSFSSIGSVPAPKEVVECMPVKVYMKPQKNQNEEAAQCYICLAEYEDGDFMRILPCSHEFHRSCIDKWLKEIHRVCPLCRGDVCRFDALGTEKIG